MLQWSALLPQLQGRVVLQHENTEFISFVEANPIPTYQSNDLASLQIPVNHSS